MSWQSLLSEYTVQVVLAGSFILGITSGILGCFAVLRKQSLLGDAIAHATLPGVCLAFWMTGSKHPLILLLGAGLAGWVGALFIILITSQTRIKKDAALGIVLSVFFGLGLVLLTMVQKLPTAQKAGLDKFLFGSAATLLKVDVQIMFILSCITLLCVFMLWKEFKVLVFDDGFAQSIGLPINSLNIMLTTLIVVSIVIGLQTVGVVLMSAMIVAPAAAARQWTDRLAVMIFVSAFFGVVSAFLGVITSSLVANIPTGPMIVIYLSIIVIISLGFAPNRGLVWDWIRTMQNRKKIQTTSMLKNMLLFSEISTDPFHPHDIAALQAIGRGALQKTMEDLKRKGWVKQYQDLRWALTPKGLEEAKAHTEAFEESIYGEL